jgi:tetracycline 7-halogenase / FADH2 O2-dependent halogenase
MPRLAYRAANAAGARWAMLPSAAAFVDPLFSTGIPLTLLGVERIAAALQGRPEGRPLHGLALHGPTHDPRGRPSDRPFDEYADVTLAEADHTARFVARCYEAFPRFHEFVDRSMFYFVAASFSEMSRRLGQPGRGFLCAADEEFADAMTRRVPQDPACSSRVFERLNVAGLCDREKRNWYGVDLEDTIRGAAKLGVTADDVRAMLALTLPATG